jgi:hypothetical protein
MRLFYDPEHPSEKLYGIKRWKMTDGRIRATLYYADHGERWVIKGKDMKELEPGAWLPYAEDGLDAEFDNPYGEVPIFHYRTAAPYGVPEHIDAYGPQAAINKAMINQVATMGLAGFPARYALQDDKVLDNNVDDPDWDDDAEAEGIGESLAGMAQGSKMRNAPGALNWLTGVKDLKEFPAAPPGVFLEPMTVYARLMGQVTDTPGYRLNFTGEPPSGESLKVDNQPLNRKAETRQAVVREHDPGTVDLHPDEDPGSRGGSRRGAVEAGGSGALAGRLADCPGEARRRSAGDSGTHGVRLLRGSGGRVATGRP